MALISPDDILAASEAGSDTGDGGTSLSSSLSDLASSLVQSVAKSAAGAAQGAIEGKLNNPTRSTATAPIPDLTASAAKPMAAFVNSSVGGISLPILLLGGAALLYIVVRR